MATIDTVKVKGFIATGKNAKSTTAQGKALEDLVCYIFGLIPGILITRRNQKNIFSTEEIDVALWNEKDPKGLFFFDHLVLIECKNWSKKVGSEEVSWFDTKLQHRGLIHGILVSTLGITGDKKTLGDAHSIVAAALRDGRRLVVITTDEILAMKDTDDLVLAVKNKICDLVVSGSLA